MIVKFFNYFVAACLFTMLAASFSFAQENEPTVIDEVVAQVNDGVITLSRVKRETSNTIIGIVQQTGKPEAQVRADIETKQGELIAGMINDELLMQKGKELGLDEDVDASINKRFLEIMKEQSVKTLDELFRRMRDSGINPEEIRATWRAQAMREAVLNREVEAKLYHGFSGKEIKDYFEKNKQKFIKPETITISEIFLSLAGRDEKTVRAKADDLVKQLRAGADFQKLALENSERQNVKETKGKVGTFSMSDLKSQVSEPLKGLKPGEYTEPVQLDEGFMILRVDERVMVANEAKFNEDDVRNALTFEKSADERKKYMVTLRRDAYIKISENYRAMVSPVLFADERTDKPVAKNDKNDK
jgi:parvulin-like peptidyl-prolyl isomerase